MLSKIRGMLGLISPRVAAFCAAALVIASYFFPLWGYSIYAPQYPEGLYMTIWSDHLGGDIRNINILNHYVGMKEIDAADFREFKVTPPILGAFALVAIILIVFPWTPLFWAWVVAFLAGAVVGGWDLARWGYDFGTELSATAPIKVPGMHFVPPLIGKKVMLNITSYSYPHVGGALLGLALLFMSSVVVSAPFRKTKVLSGLALLLLVFPGCTSKGEPEPIRFGSDTCAHCRMTISDNRFGGEIIMKGGKVYKFDALECVRQYSESNKDKVAKVFFLDFFDPGKFVSSNEAQFVKASSIRGPMGQDHLVSGPRSLDKLKKEGSLLMNWQEYKKQAEARQSPSSTGR